MAEMDIRQRVTADELLNLPDDGKRYELIEGELITLPLTDFEHGRIKLDFGYVIHQYAHKDHSLGRVLVGDVGFYTRHSNDTVRSADIIYFSYRTLPKRYHNTGYLRISPDLVVEVISPNDRTGDIDDKMQEWLDFGVRMVWNVYPARRQVHVYTPDADKPLILFADDVLNGGDVLSGFSVNVRELFED